MTVYTNQLEARYPLLHARVLTSEGSVVFFTNNNNFVLWLLRMEL